MSCISWNCWGLGNLRAIHALNRLVLAKDLMVIFLCKTKSLKEHMERLKSQLNFDCLFSVPSKGSSGGLGAMWKEEANLSLQSYSNNHMDLDVGGVGKPN